MKIMQRLREHEDAVRALAAKLHQMQESLGRIEMRQTRESFNGDLKSAEFRVFSQWGEDGILQALIHAVQPARKLFIEFGVQTYVESSTRFLLINDNWGGLVIDGDQANINYIRNDPIHWQYNLKTECEFITTDNINAIFARNGLSGEIGILSVDIDGNDYWVWKAIDSVSPAIVITEYNARFGPTAALTVPYDPKFVRTEAHHSNVYYGASLGAMCQLAQQKGYALVGCNTAGNNAFFVRRDLMKAPLRELTPEEGYVRNQFREGRTADGKLAFLSNEGERELMKGLPAVDVSGSEPRTITL